MVNRTNFSIKDMKRGKCNLCDIKINIRRLFCDNCRAIRKKQIRLKHNEDTRKTNKLITHKKYIEQIKINLINGVKEIWKDIKDYEGMFQVSNYGRVKSFKNKGNKILKGNIDGTGYTNVNLSKCDSKGYIQKIYKIHTLVWDYFGSSKRNGIKLQVDHIDENKLNNHINNLQLLSQRENLSKGWKKYDKSSKYTGVCWNKKTKKWMGYIQIEGKQYVKYFDNEIDAHNTYQEKLKEHNKKKLNRYEK